MDPKQYFQKVVKTVESRLFNIIAHPDVIRKFTGRFLPSYDFADYQQYARKLIGTLIKNNVGIEVNSSGYNMLIADAYPSEEFLKMYIKKARERNVQPIITIGSDAHRIDKLGKGVEKLPRRIEEAGSNGYCTFKERVPKFNLFQ